MGIQVEFNIELALRNFSECTKGTRTLEECIPESIIKGQTYTFLKKGQRIYALGEEMPLVETTGNKELSKPLASIVISEATHYLRNSEPHTIGKYKIIKSS